MSTTGRRPPRGRDPLDDIHPALALGMTRKPDPAIMDTLMSAIDDYIAAFPARVRRLLQQIRRTIHQEAPGAMETMSYRIPTFDVNGKHLVHFAGYAHHIGFYPGARVGSEFKDAFSAYKNGKGSVQFPLDRPLPLDLMRRVVRFRLEQVRTKTTRPRTRARTK